MRLRTATFVLVVCTGVLIGILWGWSALGAYAFFVALAAGLTYAAGLGGEWIRDVSSRRFDDRR